MIETILGIILAVVAVIVWLQLVAIRRMAKLERMLRAPGAAKVAERPSNDTPLPSIKALAKSHAKGTFECYIAEDEQRQTLTKREQAEGYREWRKQQGLTWQKGEAGADSVDADDGEKAKEN